MIDLDDLEDRIRSVGATCPTCKNRGSYEGGGCPTCGATGRLQFRPLTLDQAGELLARLRAAEAIVRDLAACNPVQGIYNGGHEVETCALCGATGEYEDELHLTGLRIEHKPTCLKRRAVEATR